MRCFAPWVCPLLLPPVSIIDAIRIFFNIPSILFSLSLSKSIISSMTISISISMSVSVSMNISVGISIGTVSFVVAVVCAVEEARDVVDVGAVVRLPRRALRQHRRDRRQAAPLNQARRVGRGDDTACRLSRDGLSRALAWTSCSSKRPGSTLI